MGVLLFGAGQAGGVHWRRPDAKAYLGQAAGTWLESTGWKELGSKGPGVLTDMGWTWASSVPLAEKVNGTLDCVGMSVTAGQGRWSLPSAPHLNCWVWFEGSPIWGSHGCTGASPAKGCCVEETGPSVILGEAERCNCLAWRREGSGGSYECVHTPDGEE